MPESHTPSIKETRWAGKIQGVLIAYRYRRSWCCTSRRGAPTSQRRILSDTSTKPAFVWRWKFRRPGPVRVLKRGKTYKGYGHAVSSPARVQTVSESGKEVDVVFEVLWDTSAIGSDWVLPALQVSEICPGRSGADMVHLTSRYQRRRNYWLPWNWAGIQRYLAPLPISQGRRRLFWLDQGRSWPSLR